MNLFPVGLFQNGDWLTHVVLTGGHHFDETAGDLRGHHDSMFVEKVVLEAATKHIATNNQLTSFQALEWGEIPKLVLIKRRHIYTTRNIDTF